MSPSSFTFLCAYYHMTIKLIHLRSTNSWFISHTGTLLTQMFFLDQMTRFELLSKLIDVVQPLPSHHWRADTFPQMYWPSLCTPPLLPLLKLPSLAPPSTKGKIISFEAITLSSFVEGCCALMCISCACVFWFVICVRRSRSLSLLSGSHDLVWHSYAVRQLPGSVHASSFFFWVCRAALHVWLKKVAHLCTRTHSSVVVWC